MGVRNNNNKMRKQITAAFGHGHPNAQLGDQEHLEYEMQFYLENAEFHADVDDEIVEDVLSFCDRSEYFCPGLGKATRFPFTIVTCSTESERVFSTAEIILNNHRSILSDSTTEVIILVGSYLRVKYATSVDWFFIKSNLARAYFKRFGWCYKFELGIKLMSLN